MCILVRFYFPYVFFVENRVIENKACPFIHTHDEYGHMVIRVRLRTIIPYRCYILLHAYRADRRNVKKCIYFFKTLLKNGREHLGRVFRRVPTTNVTDVVRVTSNGASKARVGRRTNTYTLFVVFIRRVQYACLARACVQYVNKHIYRGDVTCRTRREHRFCMYSCFTRVYGVSHGR